MKKSIAIIPARGGSKRIPRKNIREFLGKPIIAYSIEAARESKLFDIIMVSTDDEEISEVARFYGAEIPFFRSPQNADDYATTDDVLIEVLSEYKKRGLEFDVMACIYPAAPFVTARLLKQAFDIMEKYHPALVMPMVKYSYPPQRSYRIDQNGNAVFIEPQYIKARSQDLEAMYHDSGQFYIHDPHKMIEMNGVITEDIMAIIVDDREVQDIDTEEDWQLAEIKYRMMKKDDHQ